MRKQWIGAVLCMVLALSASTTFAATTKKTAATQAKGHEESAVKGKIVAIDAAKSSITITHGKKKKTYVVAKDSLAALKKGDRVRIVLKEGTNEVKSVKVIKE